MARPRRSYSSSSDGLSPMRTSSTKRTRVISDSNRRILVLAITAFFIVSVYLCTARLFNMSFERPDSGLSEAERKAKVKLTDADLPMSYGQYGRPSEGGLTLIRSLDAKYVPTATNGRRLIVIGDIHGMDHELKKLLTEVEFDGAKDHVIAAGDMVNKGPDSPGVINRLMKIRASAVRGNHEDRLLLAMADSAAQSGISKELTNSWSEERTGVSGHLKLARKLTKEQIRWLKDLPVILTVEDLAMLVVHAGLVPGLNLKKQDPWAVMNMRTLVYPKEDLRKRDIWERDDEDQAPEETASQEMTPQETADPEKPVKAGFITSAQPPSNSSNGDTDMDKFIGPNTQSHDVVAIPVDDRQGTKWAKEWNKFQLRLKKPYRRTVFYGHDAKQGYREGKYSFGLDSSCVRGGHLTALIVEADAADKRGLKTTKKQVKCEKFYK